MNMQDFNGLLLGITINLRALCDAPSWKVAERPQSDRHLHGKLSGPDGACLWLMADGWRSEGKLEISGHFPDHDLSDVKSPSIGVGETRGATVTAREIHRRLLPGYLADLARVNARNTVRDAKRAARLAFATELTALMGGDVHDGASDTTVNLYRNDHGRIDARIGHDAPGVYLTARVTADEMRQIAAILNPTKES